MGTIADFIGHSVGLLILLIFVLTIFPMLAILRGIALTYYYGYEHVNNFFRKSK